MNGLQEGGACAVHLWAVRNAHGRIELRWERGALDQRVVLAAQGTTVLDAVREMYWKALEEVHACALTREDAYDVMSELLTRALACAYLVLADCGRAGDER